MKKTPFFFFILVYAFLITTLSASFQDLFQKEEERTPLKVLSWDGGGIRGLFSLYVAKEVEKRMNGVGLVEQADWLAGTSTGGIIALALAHGATLDEAINIYKNNGDKIFQKEGFSAWRWLKGLFDETYSDTGILQELKEVLGEETTLGDLEKGVIVTSYDIEGGENAVPGPYVFNSRKEEFQTVKLWEAGRATSAAPTFFEPYYGFPNRSLIDGGVVLNHPGDVALDEISSLYPRNQRENVIFNIDMLSFGTGLFYSPMTREDSKDMGKLDWAGPISGLMMQGVSQVTDTSLRNTLGSHYVRLNATLDRPIPLDGVSETEIAELEHVALEYVKNNPKQIERAARLMLQ
ncbi:MAG: hypothetical protein GW748_06000 [Alphaproteobacteria bacterium]|nr:hypothetical protein [Alphaproteobacteria bacterium]NCQ67279.1 hypothetical protein [Alphaproteobacteria bacterium]NCT06754.1 hypothetical protein [Alphaproteobacteria bacterium]